MSDLWEPAFAQSQTMWGLAPTRSANLARDLFVHDGARDVLIPGVGYGRNARPFLEAGLAVTGIEISATAIALARGTMGLTFPIHHGSVTDMPFDDHRYDAVFAFGLLYLFDAPTRAQLLRACAAQLRPGGHMVFTLIAKSAPMYGRGTRLAEDWYETHPGMRLYFYDEASVQRELGPLGQVEQQVVEEPSAHGPPLPFIYAAIRTPR